MPDFSLAFNIFKTILSYVWKILDKLRLTIPLFYLIIVSIVSHYNDWVNKNANLFGIIFYIIIGLVAISWIITFIKYIKSIIK